MEVEWDRVMTYASRSPIDDKIPIRKMDRIRNTKLYNPLTASRVSQRTHDDPLPGQSASVNSPRRERTSSNPYRHMLVYGSRRSIEQPPLQYFTSGWPDVGSGTTLSTNEEQLANL